MDRRKSLLTLAIWWHDLVVDNASHRRYRAAEAEIESWLGNKANTRAMYDGLLKLGLTPYPKVGIKHPRYLRWRDDSRDGPSIYLGPDSIDINKARYSHLVGSLPGAIDRSRDINAVGTKVGTSGPPDWNGIDGPQW